MRLENVRETKEEFREEGKKIEQLKSHARPPF